MSDTIGLLAWATSDAAATFHPEAWETTMWFILASGLLGAFDISLPRGDTLGVSGALDAVALVLLGPVYTSAIVLFGAVLSFTLRLRASRPTHLRASVISRICGVGIAAILADQIIAGTSGSDLVLWVAAACAVAAYLVLELVMIQWPSPRRGIRLSVRAVLRSAPRQMPLTLAQMSSALLAIIVFPTVGSWCLPLVVALLLLIRQSYALLLEIRQTFRMTVEVLVDAAEGSGTEPSGHAERTSQIARSIALACPMTADDVDRMSYAALLHDVGEIGSGADSVTSGSARVVQGVTFFNDVLPILRLCDGLDATEASEADRLAAFIVALSSDIDDWAMSRRQLPAVNAVDNVASKVPSELKAKAVSAAIHLGYSVPAVA